MTMPRAKARIAANFAANFCADKSPFKEGSRADRYFKRICIKKIGRSGADIDFDVGARQLHALNYLLRDGDALNDEQFVAKFIELYDTPEWHEAAEIIKVIEIIENIDNSNNPVAMAC